MGRFYEKRVDSDSKGTKYLVTILQGGRRHVEVEVSKLVFDELDDLQREHWRLEKSESRHTRRIEMMHESDLPHDRHTKDPEQVLIERMRSLELRGALDRIPPAQERRFLLRHLLGLSVKQIAWLEGCSERAINYSLSRARENLREILS